MSMRSRALVLPMMAMLASACDSSAPKPKPADKPGEMLPIKVEGTRLVVTKPDGTRASNADLVGAVLVVSVDGSAPQHVRIDKIERDPADQTGEVLLYTFTRTDPATGQTTNVCPPDPSGLSAGFPLTNAWSPTGSVTRDPNVVELACTSGAVGKCLRLGYLPWQSDAQFARHQACVRMARADYCGNGTSYTRAGTLVNVYDPAGIQRQEPMEGLEFEAAWGADGATCVRRTRHPDLASLVDLVRACPERLTGRIGEQCSDASARKDPRTLVLNESKPK